ncbi:MerR family transcriptional regulator [Actinosynnema sp. NPDC050436]|uniref:MerR family transcriptional regulator n=1 Tax=Actinosynnema sp. NPDC050436 TaxID=3155659 RepID=UPI0033E01D7C
MAWSTSQLADLAGTTLRTIRHYHDVGLLTQPERRANGYKSYGVPHLVRVLRIKRLTDLGLSLADISELGEDDEHPGEALRRLDAELAATVDRLRRVRAEIARILHRETPTDLPLDVAALVAGLDLTPQDRSFTVVLAQLLTPEALSTYAGVLAEHAKDPALVEFDGLTDDSDEQTRQRLAERLREHPFVREMQAAFPDATGLFTGSPRGEQFALRTMAEAVVELYNAAQLDVLSRMVR